MRHQSQGFEQFPIVKSYSLEEETFLKTPGPVPFRDFPRGSHVVNSNVIYNVKQNYGLSLKFKARIASYGNGDDIKNRLASDCITCLPSGLLIADSISSSFVWTVYRADVKVTFLQTGTVCCDVYFKPPQESRMRSTRI